MCKRLLSILLCLCLTLSLPLTALGQQQEEVIHIRNVQDLLDLAKNCMLDSYSRGKTVLLHCDLDLKDVEFSGIATFGGTFEGQGHTISGLHFTDQRSVAGFFRYLQPGAVVRDLRVNGRVAPGGTAATVGGIVGSNHGMLINCHFEGSVAGTSSVGGIAGVNEADGAILRSTAQGVAVGETMIGGMVGYNLGLIEACENHVCVNTETPDESLDLGSIDLSVLMDPAALASGVTVMDIGGIAGYSIGAIYDCENFASIGYSHIGYNVGGIAGRSSGIISGCTNRADIRGRKDVGGIVGQMEPHVSINLDEDHLLQLETQFGEMEDLIRQLQGSVDDLGAVRTHLNTTVDLIDDAGASLQTLTGYVGDYGSALTGEINRASLLLQDAMEQMIPVLEQAVLLGESLEKAIDTMAEAMGRLSAAADYLEVSFKLMNSAMADLQQAGDTTTQALARISQGVQLLASGLQVKDQEQMSLALAQIEAGLQQLADAAEQVTEVVERIAEALQEQGNWNDNAAVAFDDVLQALSTMSDALRAIGTGVSGVMGNLAFDTDAFWGCVAELRAGMDALSQSLGYLESASDDLRLILNAMEMGADRGGQGLGILSTGMSQLADSVQRLTYMTDLLRTAITNISHYEPIQLPQMDSGVNDATDALFESVNGIADEMRSILSLAGAFSDDAKAQLNAIYEKYQQMLSTAMALVDQLLSTVTDGLVQDTSDADIDAVTAGKVSNCANRAQIMADINAGGIAGAMAIDYQLDPEDDLTGELSQYQLRSYQAKAVIQNCSNLSLVNGKRSYVGGICGRMDLGIILQSQSFGNVSSTEGDYVGGIAGSAAGAIRSCGVKANVSGGKYVGGVAGLAAAVTECRTLVQLSGREFVGAILGYAQDLELTRITENYYFSVDSTVGAIDGISYEDHARNATWDFFLDSPVTGQSFGQVELTFCFADGTTQVLTLPVGTALEQGMIPQLENSAQQIHYWADLDAQLGQQQYFDRTFTETEKNMISVLESEQTRSDGKPILLLQGSFLAAEKLQLSALKDLPQALEGWQFELPEGGKVEKIRYAIADGVEAVTILVQEGGQLRQVLCTQSGSYMVFSLEEGTTAFYVIASGDSNNGLLWIGILGATVVAAVGFAIVLIKKRKKSK